jgi:hypothetical protein
MLNPPCIFCFRRKQRVTNVKSVFLGNSWGNSQNDSMWLVQFSAWLFKVWVPFETYLNLKIMVRLRKQEQTPGSWWWLESLTSLSVMASTFYRASHDCYLLAVKTTLAKILFVPNSFLWGYWNFTHFWSSLCFMLTCFLVLSSCTWYKRVEGQDVSSLLTNLLPYHSPHVPSDLSMHDYRWGAHCHKAGYPTTEPRNNCWRHSNLPLIFNLYPISLYKSLLTMHCVPRSKDEKNIASALKK